MPKNDQGKWIEFRSLGYFNKECKHEHYREGSCFSCGKPEEDDNDEQVLDA